MAILTSLRVHLAQLITKHPPNGAGGRKQNVHPRQSIRPSVRLLEPRFVLNASAELTALGQLVITGTDASDYVRLNVNSNGQITLQNELGLRIDIVGNPNGQTEPLNPEAIFSKQIQINLLGGNDTLDLAIPSGLNVSVVDGDGNDTIKIIRPDTSSPNESATHHLVAQSIRFDDTTEPIGWWNQNFRLSGDVFVGASLSTTTSEILIDSGSWEVSGRLILQSDVDFLSNTLGGSVDLSDATLTTDQPSSTLTFDLGHSDAAVLILGNIDDSGTAQIENLAVKSANTVNMQSPTFNLPGELSIQSVSHNLTIEATTILFFDASLTTDSGDIQIDGPVTLIGGLDVKTLSGDVTFTNTLDGNHQLVVDAGTGAVSFQNDIGEIESLSPTHITGSTITIQSLTTRDGDITFNANEIELFGDRIETMLSGEILYNGPVTVHRLSSEIRSSGTVQFNSTIQGKIGTESLLVTADDRIDLASGAQQIGSLSLLANNTIQTTGKINVNQDFTARADLVIIAGDIVLMPDSSGTITLDGTYLVQVAHDSTLSLGNGILFIQTEGVVDTANSTITSDLSTAALVVRGASIITLGNIDHGNGLVDLQTVPLSSATITQATGTTIIASRLRISAGGDVLLFNPNNDFQFFEDLNIRGELRVRDDVGDLTITNTLVLGTTHKVFTAGTLYLLDNAITASQADVNLLAGMSIINSAIDPTQYNIAGKTLTMNAVTGIGSSARIHLQSIRSLDVTTVDGGVDLRQQTLTDTTITRLASETGLVKLEQFGLSTLLIQTISSDHDGVSIHNHAGSVDLALSPAGGNTIRGGEFGRIAVEADRFIRMPDGSRIDADRGTIFLASVEDIAIGGLKTLGTQANAIEVWSLAGSIIDSGDQDIDIDANNGGVILTAFSAIGHDNQLETAIDRLTANVISTGSINIVERDSINLLNVSTHDGPIHVIADGTITATNVVSANTFAIDGPFGAPLSRDITLEAKGPTSDILVGQITANHSADVLLVAGDDILGIGVGMTVEVIADDLEIIAENASDDGGLAVALTTDINDLLLTINGTARGDAEIRQLNSLSLASSDLRSDAHPLRTSNGEIRIIAGESIIVLGLDDQNDQTTPLGDPEIIAGGPNGRIVLIASDTIELGNQTQIVAAQSTPGAVRFESSNLILGESIEINTGSGVGIAKYFLPRPASEQMDTAFYDATTIRTDTLTQENAKNAKGFLTLKVGLPGERGLQVDIDWGAPSNCFQTITDISADNSRLVDGEIDISGPFTDNPLLQVSHVYLESDILNTVLNGRASATDPLNVRLSVSHHESIIIFADKVTQGFDESATPLSAQIVGRLVSSTDNPLTVGVLESGTARFIIPNLSIPVAFFPVREIIPEPVKLESLARPIETALLSTGSLESESGSASSLATRDEFFQIRILSPDPFGEDLADPKRLPDDILSGDKLQQLFKDLPDGRYEIGYVFGDGNVRSLLTIDNRDGVTKVLGQEIEGGPLRLERLSPTEINTQPLIDSQFDSAIPNEEITKPTVAEFDNDLPADIKAEPEFEDQGVNGTWHSADSLTSVAIVGGFFIDQIVPDFLKSRTTQSSVVSELKLTNAVESQINRFSIVGRFLSRHKHSRSCNDSH